MSAGPRLGASIAVIMTVIAFASAPVVATGGPVAGVYDFEHLTVGALHGQDGWKVVGNNSGVTSVHVPDGVGRNTIVPGHVVSKAARQLQGGANVNSRAVRRNDAIWAITPMSTTGVTVIEFEMNHPYWGGAFSLGISTADGTDITTGIEVLSRNEGTSKHRVRGPGGTLLATHTTRVAQFGRYQLVLDALDGTVSLAINDLDPASTAGWVAPAILQNLPAGLNTAVAGSDPLLWDALRLHSESFDPTSLFDNITFRTIEPSTRSLDLGATPLTTTSTDAITIGGLHLAGRLTATIVGAGFSFDDDTTTRAGIATGALTVRFTPDALGDASGSLTVVGDDMVRPLVIALDASGTPEPPAPPAAGPAEEPAPPAPFVDCHGAQPIVAVELTCTIGIAGAPGAAVTWSAGYNPVFRTGTVTLDAQGHATITVVPPAAAVGAMLWVEVNAAATPVDLGIVEGVRPTRIPAGDGPSVPPFITPLRPLVAVLGALLGTLLLGTLLLGTLPLAPPVAATRRQRRQGAGQGASQAE